MRLVYDSKELYQELPSLKRRKSSFLFWRLVEKTSIRYIDSVFTVNRSIADILERNWRLPTTVILNVPSPENNHAETKRNLDRVYLAFSGGIQPGRGIDRLIELLTLLPEKYRLKIIGNGNMRSGLETKCESLKLKDRVEFVGRVKNDEVVSELSKAHLGVYLMENSGLCHYLALPNKLFQFIMAQLPVVVSNFPEMRRVVEKFDVGAIIDPTNLREAAENILAMTSDENRYWKLVDNCRKAGAVLNWETEKVGFLNEMKRLLQN